MVTGIPEPVSISWHRRLRWRTVSPLGPEKAELRIASVKDSDAGEYHCEASTGSLSLPSNPVTIRVKGASVTGHLRSDRVARPREDDEGECGDSGRGLDASVNLRRKRVKGRALEANPSGGDGDGADEETGMVGGVGDGSSTVIRQREGTRQRCGSGGSNTSDFFAETFASPAKWE